MVYQAMAQRAPSTNQEDELIGLGLHDAIEAHEGPNARLKMHNRGGVG
jgi:hypothetical protein